MDLSSVLCLKETRTLIDGCAFSYKGQYYQLAVKDRPINPLPKMKVTVLDHVLNGIRCQCKEQVYDTILLQDRPKKKEVCKVQERKRSLGSTPATDHPWRNTKKKSSPWYGIERDSETLAMLNELFSSTRAWA